MDKVTQETEGKEKQRNILAIFFVLAVLTIFLYPVAKLYWAKRNVSLFCAQVEGNMTASEIEAAARALGLKFSKYPVNSSEPEQLSAWQGWIFARYNCTLYYKAGKLISKGIILLD